MSTSSPTRFPPREHGQMGRASSLSISGGGAYPTMSRTSTVQGGSPIGRQIHLHSHQQAQFPHTQQNHHLNHHLHHAGSPSVIQPPPPPPSAQQQDPGAGCCVGCCPDPRDPCCTCVSESCCSSGHQRQHKPPKFLPPTCCDWGFCGLVILAITALIGFVVIVVMPMGSEASLLVLPISASSVPAALLPTSTTSRLEHALCNQPKFWAGSSSTFRPGYCTQYTLAPNLPTGRTGLECSPVQSSLGLVSYFISLDSSVSACAEDYFSVTTIMLVHSIIQHYLLGSLLGLFILAVVGIVTAVYYNDNGWAVELLVIHGVILPPAPEPTNNGLTGNCLTDCCIQCGMLPAGRPGMPEPSLLACCCSCCTDNNTNQQQQIQRQQSSGSTTIGDTITKSSTPVHHTPSAATFPILFSNTPQCLWWVSIWRAIGLVHLVTSIWVLYAVLSLSTTWLQYTSGDLRAVLSALHLKVILGAASTFIVCNLPLVWKVIFAPAAWCMCIVPWYCYRVVGDSRVLSRPEGYQSSEEREAALREGFYSLTLEAAVQQQRVRDSSAVPPPQGANVGGGSGARSPSTTGLTIATGSGTRPLSAENVARLQYQQQLHASQLAGLAILNPSRYAANPPTRTYGMGDISTMSRHAAIHQHNLLTARLQNGGTQSTNATPTGAGATAGGVTLSPESLAIARQLLAGGGGVTASGSVRSLTGSVVDNASASMTSVTERGATIDLPSSFGQTTSSPAMTVTNNVPAQLLFMSKDPDAMESELSFCQRLDQFFVDDCGFCAAFQRQQQDILLATHEQRIRSALAAAGVDDAGTDAMMGSVASKQAQRRVVGFDSTVEDQSLQKAHRNKKDKDKKSKEKRSKEKKDSKSKSKEKKEKSKKSKNHGHDSSDDDDDLSAPEPRPDTANPLLARSTSTVASEIHLKKAKRDKGDKDDDSSRATSPSSKKSKKEKKDKKKKKDKQENGSESEVGGDFRAFAEDNSDDSDDDDVSESRSTTFSFTTTTIASTNGGGNSTTTTGALSVLDFTNTSPSATYNIPDLRLEATSNSLRGSQMLGGSSGKFSPRPAGSDYGDDPTSADHEGFQRVVSSQSMPSLGLNTIRSNNSGDGVAAFETALAKLSTKHNNHGSLSEGTLMGVNDVSSRRRSISNSRHSDAMATALSPRSNPLIDKDVDGTIKRSSSKAASSKKDKDKKDKSRQKEGSSSPPPDAGLAAVARTKSEKADKKANKEKKRKNGGESEGNVFASFEA